jgi:PEP-CTERM motif
MKLCNRVLTAIAFLGLGGVSASAATINLATGLDGSGTLQTTGNAGDANWTYNDPGVTPNTGSAKVVAPYNADSGSWLANGPNSSWIAPYPDLTDNGPAPYTFARTFDLSGYILSSVIFSGSWTIDDAGTVALNGTQISSLGSGAWYGLTAFTQGAATLNQGLNTLTITMTSADQHMEAVRLEGSVNGDLAPTGVPEPATWALFGLGAAAVGMLRRRKAW